MLYIVVYPSMILTDYLSADLYLWKRKMALRSRLVVDGG